MADVKKIKSVDITPFTVMSSSIHAILAFIAAILMLIAFGIVAALIPGLGVISAVITWVGVALVIIYPISTFFISIVSTFFSVWLYNMLEPRVGGIKLGLEGNEVQEIPVVSFALILSCIGAIWAFIIGLFLAAVIAPFTALISNSIPVIAGLIANSTNVTNATNMAALPTGAAVSAGGVVLSVILIIGMPIAVFILGFISAALAAIFYNFLATKVAKVQLEFAAVTETVHELKSIPVVPAALSLAVVFGVFGFLQGLGRLFSDGILGLIGSTIGMFIEGFIVVALVAIFYNFLAPRIGGVKLDLE